MPTRTMPASRSNAGRSPGRPRPSSGSSTADFELLIHDRIVSRLASRVRNLGVSVSRGVIHLTGECSTYYSKQLAQHAVLGVVEDETIKNDIKVTVPTATGGMRIST